MNNNSEWMYLEDGAIMNKRTGKFVAAADLAWNSEENKPMILVNNIIGPPMPPVWVELTQVNLLEILFQLAALMTGEYYPTVLQEGTFVVANIWIDKTTGWYYHTDEAGHMIGPYKTQGEAQCNLDAYAAFMNQPNPFTLVV